ncbi:MAG: hypothetical protein OEV50_01560, partial [Candidatus Aminicenantes bacterium]|nr:hypothetical protein [Candidatus Aminicenantes bacterium]
MITWKTSSSVDLARHPAKNKNETDKTMKSECLRFSLMIKGLYLPFNIVLYSIRHAPDRVYDSLFNIKYEIVFFL